MEDKIVKEKKIKVELFALCEGAFNNSGHLTIVNTYDDFVVDKLPARVSFGLAFKLYIQPQIEGDKLLTIEILDSKKENILAQKLHAPIHVENLDTASHIALAINFQNVLFVKEGKYDIHLEIDGVKLDNFAFEVQYEQK